MVNKEGHVQAFVDWNYNGKTDIIAGTGATWIEKNLVWIASISAVLLYLYFYLSNRLDWPLWKYIVACIIAFDIGGGVVANNLNSCKRFFHTPRREDEKGYVALLKNHIFFVSFHIHPIIVGLLYEGKEGLLYGLSWYFSMMIVSIIVLNVALYLRRPIAMMAILWALIVNSYILLPVSGFEWLAPALFVKIVYGHIVREEPYRPKN